ncbi:MAG: hypothetical protein GX279_13095 [Clostridiaceae bacterium]|nr:hypothetical protein [Clostridiaceae bacterium]
MLFALLLLTALAACGADRHTGSVLPNDPGSETDIVQNGTEGDGSDISAPGAENTVPADSGPPDIDSGEADGTDDVNGVSDADTKRELLQSASIDLDGDGINEQVKAFKVTLDSSDNVAAVRLEGRLEITDGDIVKEIVFWKKDDDLSGIMSSLQFEDMDGDGAKDVFVIIPGYGASFTYSNCFIYSYAKDKSCIFTSDNELADFISGFRFAYEAIGSNRLNIINDRYGFSAGLVIEDDFSGSMEEITLDYADRSWIDPTSVDISESSKLSFIKKGDRAQIKVPLPIFGTATVNMIGEVDLYYSIDNDFRLVLEKCDIIDFDGDKKVVAGSLTPNSP